MHISPLSEDVEDKREGYQVETKDENRKSEREGKEDKKDMTEFPVRGAKKQDKPVSQE